MNKPILAAVLAAMSWSVFAAPKCAAKEPSWPDLAKPANAIGGGARDAAVIVGIENYGFVSDVPGAESNADEWYDYLAKTRLVPPENIVLLTGNDATREQMLVAATKAAGYAGEGGTLWFVFIGHGAASVDGKDGLLVGVDAQQKAESIQSRSARRQEILAAFAASRAAAIRVVIDACFSGRGRNGANLVRGLQPLKTLALADSTDSRTVILTAARQDQFAGPLPGTDTPAFSYLILGGLRGWAAGPDGSVTSGALLSYSTRVLQATLHGREQTPDLIGSPDALIAVSAGEKAPDLAQLAKDSAGISDRPVKVRSAKHEKGAKLWIEAGAAGTGIDHVPLVNWHVRGAVRDLPLGWEFAVDGGGFARSKELSYPHDLIEEQAFRASYERLSVARLVALERKSPIEALPDFVFPSFASVGAGVGFYETTNSFSLTIWNLSDRRTSVLILPNVSAGLHWPLTSHQEVRIAAEYVFPTGPKQTANVVLGGLGFSADLGLRFK